MNFRNVFELVRIYSKAKRALRDEKMRKYTENNVLTYLFYGGSLVLGAIIGISVGLVFGSLPLERFFPIIPTLTFFLALFFSIGAKTGRMQEETNAEISPWLPISWEEHTLASSLVNIIGVPLGMISLICLAALCLSIVIGEFVLGTVCLISIAIVVFMASLLGEAFSILVKRLMDKLSASSGRFGIWLRFAGTLVLGIGFFFLWVTVIQGAGGLAEIILGVQLKAWFIPALWPGVALSLIAEGNYTGFLVLLSGAGILDFGLFQLSTKLNMRFEGTGSVSFTIRKGEYSYGTGILGRMGFSRLEASLISKDFRAFTRDRKLMGILFAPLFILLWPLIQGGNATLALPLMAPAIISMGLGSVVFGSEGKQVWHLYSMPITAKKLLKSKYFFVTICSTIIAIVGLVVFLLMFQPSPTLAILISIISLTIAFTLPLIELKGGITGAEFTEGPNPKMVKSSTSFIYTVLGTLIILPMVIPLLYIWLSKSLSLSATMIPVLGPYIIVIGLSVSYLFYRLDLREMEKFLGEVEV